MHSAPARRAETRVIALRSASEVEVFPDQPPHPEPGRQLRDQSQAGVGHQVAVIEGDVELRRRVRDLHLTGDPRLRRWL
jgi:hypothetical protein